MGRWRFYFVCCVFTTLAVVVVFVNQRYGGIVVPLLAEPQLEGTEVEKRCRNRSCWEKEQEARKFQLWDTCSAFRTEANTFSPPLIYKYDTLKNTKALSHLMVIHSHRLIYCFIPKVSTTSWKRLFLKLENFSDSVEAIGQKQSHRMTRANFRRLDSYPLHKARQLLATYTKFVFVRNPFERLLSAYQDKFQNDYPASHHFRTAWSKKIIQFSAPSPAKLDNLVRTQRRKDGTLNVTFSQFAKFVSANVRGNVNAHWMSMYGLCHPCLIDYDWIGHYDSLLTDADFILTAAGVDPAIRFPNFTTNPTGSSDPRTLFRYYSALTKYENEAVYKHFYVDFGLFGFEIPTGIKYLLDREHVYAPVPRA